MEFSQTAKVVTLEHLAEHISQIAIGRDIIVYSGMLTQRHGQHYPIRFESLIAIMCKEGSFTVSVDLQTIHVKRGTLLIIRPQNYVS